MKDSERLKDSARRRLQVELGVISEDQYDVSGSLGADSGPRGMYRNYSKLQSGKRLSSRRLSSGFHRNEWRPSPLGRASANDIQESFS